MEDHANADEMEKVKKEFLDGLKDALDQVNWSCVPFPVTFAEVFRLVTDRWHVQWMDATVRFLKEHNLFGDNWKAAMGKIIMMSDNILKGLIYWGGNDYKGPIEIALCYGLLTDQIEYDKDGHMIKRCKELMCPPPESPEIQRLMGLAGAHLHWHFAENYIDRLDATTKKRVPRLFELMTRFGPSSRTSGFIHRVTQCYLLGMDVECIVMCRSVLEAELEAQISNDQCIDILGSRGYPNRYNTVDRIEVAKKMGIFTLDQAEKAHRIRKKGNDAIHQLRVENGFPVMKIMQDALELVDALTKDK